MWKHSLQSIILAIAHFLAVPFCLVGQTTQCASVDQHGLPGSGEAPSLSADGRFLTFMSGERLVSADTNSYTDIFLFDFVTGTTELVSVDSFGIQVNGYCFEPSISADGRYVAFQSYADNLVPGDTNGVADIFVHDRIFGLTERVSVSSSGVESDGFCREPSISADGNYVAFNSVASNLSAVDTNNLFDVFVHDRVSGETQLVSLGLSGTAGNEASYYPEISANGRYVVFDSYADNFIPGDTNLVRDVFVRDLAANTTIRVNVNSQGESADVDGRRGTLSADGRIVAFQAGGSLLPGAPNGSTHIYARDLVTGVTQRMTVHSDGSVANEDLSYAAAISADGRFVSFESNASNLAPNENSPGYADIFVHDRQTRITERISRSSNGEGGNRQSWESSISADGRYVVFQSLATNLVESDVNQTWDVFVRDRWSGLGENSVYLAGPLISPITQPVVFNWQTSRGNSSYWLAWSLNVNNSTISGHLFDIGDPITISHMGVNPDNGIGSFTSNPTPSAAAGLTVYFEVAVQDELGIIYDSNVHAIQFH